MTTILNGQEIITQNFSVETVRNILKLDNKGIAKLCAQVSLMPKKDRHGRSYFSKDDIEILKRVKTLQVESKSLMSAGMSNPVQKEKKQLNNAAREIHKINQKAMETLQQAPIEPMLPVIRKPSAASVQKILASLEDMENSITDKISKIIDEKLDGMDEVIVELVRCKTENETLRYKMNELSKENYNLKNELSQFKSLGLGFYVKKSNDSML